VSWGTIPTHDRRLVILEEIKGADQEVIAKLTDMRSSGIAELQKIERRRAHARTRLIMTSNPRSQRPISAHNFGVEAVKQLIGGLEDIRRFDLVVILAAEQVDEAVVNALRASRPEVAHAHTAELCRRAVLWAWTRRPDQVEFAEGVVEAIMRSSSALCEIFTEAMPLVDRGTVRFKLARMAVALAARTFSTPADDMETVRVRPCHVEYLEGFVRALYSDPAFGYRDFSLAQEQQDKIVDAGIVKRQLLGTRYPADLVRQLLRRDEIASVDVEDWCEVDQETARKLVALLVRKHCLSRRKRHYVKSGEFIKLLKAMEVEGIENVVHTHEDDVF
jgi:hypothetical protein